MLLASLAFSASFFLTSLGVGVLVGEEAEEPELEAAAILARREEATREEVLEVREAFRAGRGGPDASSERDWTMVDWDSDRGRLSTAEARVAAMAGV